ncbi:MAG: homoserine dehydrogenase, partial [Clostridiales bacterium]|nr:homoserine dehydrogenase [Clostridiales bacterium]
DGIDSCRKICILTALAFGQLVPVNTIYTEGIRGITSLDVENAEAVGYSIKLIGRSIRDEKGRLRIMVSPCLVSQDNPLSHIDDVYNGIMVKGNYIGDVMFYGRGAGALPTASAVVADIINIAVGSASSMKPWKQATPEVLGSMDSFVAASYICVKEVAAAAGFIKDCFGEVRMIPSAKKGTLAFITPSMTEVEAKEKISILETIGASLISRIRVL